MQSATKQLPRWVPWSILAVVVVAGGWYVTSLRGDIRRLEVAQRAPAAEPAPAAAKTADAPGPTQAAPADPPGAWQLTDAERGAMLFHLGADGTSTDSPIWFVTDTRSVEAVAMQRSLRRVFEEAGWQVRGNSPA